MGSQSLSLPLAFISFFLVISSSLANRIFYVGGKDGWVLHPSEPYTHWSSRLRFLINDTLIFKYKKGKDSVLEVNKDDYKSCNTKKPLKSLTFVPSKKKKKHPPKKKSMTFVLLKSKNIGSKKKKSMISGTSFYQLSHSGPFFFISGKKNHCKKGQKLSVVVLSPRPISPKPKPPSPSPSPKTSPSPSSNPPSTSPTATPPLGSELTPSPSPAGQSSNVVSPSPAHSASAIVSASLSGLAIFAGFAVLVVSP